MRADRILDDSVKTRIRDAVAQAEQRTSAEIVCVCATESGRYDRAEAIIGLVTSLIALCATHLIYHATASANADWGIVSGGVALGWQVAAVVSGFTVGVLLASYWHGLRRLAVREAETTAEVRAAAGYVFAASSIRSTCGSTGLLIYVSLFERCVVVLADDATLTALGDDGLTSLRDTAVAELKAGRVEQAFVATVAQAAEELATALPADRTLNPDELSNAIVTFHPRPMF